MQSKYSRETISLTWYQRVIDSSNLNSSASFISSLLLSMAAVPAPIDRAFGVTNIKQHIPVILDTDVHNYDAWRELFLLHCQSLDVAGHLDGTLEPADANDAAWTKKDGLVKLWLYGTLSKNLFKSTFRAGGTSRDVWLRIENFFRNNKEARAIQLDNQLRTKERQNGR